MKAAVKVKAGLIHWHDWRADTRIVVRAIVHEGYNRRDHMNDIALLKLDRPFQPRKGPNGDHIIHWVCPSKNDYPIGTELTVGGWGDTVGYPNDAPETGNPYLLNTNIMIQNNHQCKKFATSFHFNPETQWCAAGPGKDSCVGDSGGPAVYTSPKDGTVMLYGVVSYGPKQCASPDRSGYYTKVPGYRKWIVDQILKYNLPLIERL